MRPRESRGCLGLYGARCEPLLQSVQRIYNLVAVNFREGRALFRGPPRRQCKYLYTDESSGRGIIKESQLSESRRLLWDSFHTSPCVEVMQKLPPLRLASDNPTGVVTLQIFSRTLNPIALPLVDGLSSDA